MYMVCSLRLGSNFRVCSAADKKFYLRLTVEKMCGFAVLLINIHHHAAVVEPTLLFWFTIKIQKVK